MQEFFADLGIDSWTFSYILLPLLIFFARIIDVSINTIRIIFVMSGKKIISTVLGFLESLIWLLAIGEIFKNMDNILSYIAYPLGFAGGILVGMMIEEKLALGKVVVRIINNGKFNSISEYLRDKKVKHTIIKGVSEEKTQYILFCVIKRDRLNDFLNHIKNNLPESFYTVESVKQASELGMIPEESRKRGIGSWLGSIRRK